jgi:hypothetical protein
MSDVRRIALDVLKPHDPSLLAFGDRLADVESVEAAAVELLELDQEVQNVEVTVEGTALDYEAVEAAVEELGGTVHSVDRVACGAYVVGERTAGDD